MLNRNEKQQIIDRIHERFLKSKIVILTDYKGLDVETINALRRKLKAANIEYRVVKNTLLIRAAKDTDADRIRDHFAGPIAIAMGFDDPVAPAKALFDFAKENEKLEIKVGVMGNRVLDLNAIKSLSTLPSREVLLGRLLCVLNAVPTSLVRALSNVPERLLYVLQAIKDQKAAA